jgi:hypothetical protein
MDDYTKDIAKRVVRELGELNGKLNRLIGIADRPGQHDENSISPQSTSQNKDYAAVRQLLLALNFKPAPASQEKPDKRWYKTLKWWKTLFEIIGICSAIVYAGITYRQWLDAGLNFKLAQRPWVGPEFPVRMSGDPIISEVGPNQRFRWDYVFKNYGNSPALRTRGHARSYILREDGHWPEIKKDIETLYLPPDSEFTVFTGAEASDSGVSRIALSPELNTEIKDGKSLIVLGGRIEYFDEAGAKHNTTWCIIYIPDPVGTKPAARWHSCPINPVAD